MPPTRPDNDDPQSVLSALRARSGIEPKVVLPKKDTDSDVDLAADTVPPSTRLQPKGRGNYQLICEIARGGMGVILKGRDTDLGRDVAVKVLDGRLAGDPAVVQRFVEEAQIGGQLQHPGIVPVYELGLMADDTPYFTMKLVKGRTLAALLKRRTTPADDRGRLLAVFESACQTVAYAHSRGVLHRDLKPANVMVGAFGEVQVVDWGLAKVLHREGDGAGEVRRDREALRTVIETVRSADTSTGSRSLAGSVMGTPAYMAPEQAQGQVEKLDERADVFALGAILCELLTGAPPYQEVDGAVTVMQAAQAELDPARSRLERCGADPALIRLCLDCLMPAPAARPANAAAVAAAVHAYLISTEDRAQQAQVAAAEARVKAAAERRARRLTVALAAAIVAVVLVTGGAMLWLHHDRQQRIERTRDEVEEARSEAMQLEQQGRFDEALEAARRALSLAVASSADPALTERTRAFVDEVARAAAAAAAEREQQQRDATLRRRLEELSRELGEFGLLSPPIISREATLLATYLAAFRDYGVDLAADDLGPALRRFRDRGLAEEVAHSLDEWRYLVHRAAGPTSRLLENVHLLALDLDPDPLHVEVRLAIAANDLDALLRLGRSENLRALGPRMVDALGTAIVDRWPAQRELSMDMVFRCRDLFPDDYLTQLACSAYYRVRGQFEDSLVCAMAAFGLQPDSPTGRANAAAALTMLGRVPDAVTLARRGVDAAPAHARSSFVLGRALLQLGDSAGAVAELTRTLALPHAHETMPSLHVDLLVARFYAAEAGLDEVRQQLAIESLLPSIASLLYCMVDHPDPSRRDPELALATLAGLEVELGAESWRFLIEALAKARLGDWAGALDVAVGHVAPWNTSEGLDFPLLMNPVAYDFFRAVVYARAGRPDAARECYERGIVTWDRNVGPDPSVWARSDVIRWRREAEAALGR